METAKIECSCSVPIDVGGVNCGRCAGWLAGKSPAMSKNATIESGDGLRWTYWSDPNWPGELPREVIEAADNKLKAE